MFLAEWWHQIPEHWITGIALTGASGVGWLVKHFTSRSTERATAMQAQTTHESDNRVQLSVRAFDTLQGLVTNLQGEVERQRNRQQEIETNYGARIAKLERRNGRMNVFIVKLLDAYLQIKAWVTVQDGVIAQHNSAWKPRAFPDIPLPNFDDDEHLPAG